MKIMKPHANSAQQQDNAGHFSKTLHTAKAKNSQSIAATSHPQSSPQLQVAPQQGKRVGGPILVASTLREIRERLNNGGRISHDQLQEIASLINGLTPEQTQQVVEGLTDKELAALAKEMKAGGVGRLTGLTESERCDFIGMLASRLDAKQFQRVAEAFGDPATYAMVVLTQGTTSTQIGFKNAFNLSTDEFLTKAVEGLDVEGLVEFVNNASPETLNATIQALEKNGKLDEFVHRVIFLDTNMGETGHLSAVFADLAGKLSAENLMQFSAELDLLSWEYTGFHPRFDSGSALDTDGFRYDFARAIAENASSDTHIQYMQLLDVADRDQFMPGTSDGVHPNSGLIRTDVITATMILSNMKDDPESSRIIFENLKNNELEPILTVSVTIGTTEDIIQAAFNASDDKAIIKAFEAITGQSVPTELVSGVSSDPKAKARMFIIASDALEGASNVQKQAILSAMSTLLESDINGIITYLSLPNNENFAPSERKAAFVAYTAGMFETGQEEALFQELNSVIDIDTSGESTDNKMKELFQEWFDSSDGEYRNAKNLGFFFGGIIAGAHQLDWDPNDLNIALTAASLVTVGGVSLGWLQVVASLTGPIADAHNNDWHAYINALVDDFLIAPEGEDFERDAKDAWEDELEEMTRNI